MKKTIAIIGSAIALILSSNAFALAPNYSAGEQVWEATRTNNQKVCGIGLTGSNQIGTILAAGETANSGGSVKYGFKTNANRISWKITEVKIVDNTRRFSFSDDLYNANLGIDVASLFTSVNGSGFHEIAWNDVKSDKYFDTRQGIIELQPKINVNAEDFPLGTTKIQGKIVVTCSD